VSDAHRAPARRRFYVLLDGHVHALSLGSEGEQYVAVRRRRDRWLMEPNTIAWPRRGIRPGELRGSMAVLCASQAAA